MQHCHMVTLLFRLVVKKTPNVSFSDLHVHCFVHLKYVYVCIFSYLNLTISRLHKICVVIPQSPSVFRTFESIGRLCFCLCYCQPFAKWESRFRDLSITCQSSFSHKRNAIRVTNYLYHSISNTL